MASVNQVAIYRYGTKALADADIANVSVGAVAQVTNDGTYTLEGGVWVREVAGLQSATYNPATESIDFTDDEGNVSSVSLADLSGDGSVAGIARNADGSFTYTLGDGSTVIVPASEAVIVEGFNNHTLAYAGVAVGQRYQLFNDNAVYRKTA